MALWPWCYPEQELIILFQVISRCRQIEITEINNRLAQAKNPRTYFFFSLLRCRPWTRELWSGYLHFLPQPPAALSRNRSERPWFLRQHQERQWSRWHLLWTVLRWHPPRKTWFPSPRPRRRFPKCRLPALARLDTLNRSVERESFRLVRISTWNGEKTASETLGPATIIYEVETCITARSDSRSWSFWARSTTYVTAKTNHDNFSFICVWFTNETSNRAVRSDHKPTKMSEMFAYWNKKTYSLLLVASRSLNCFHFARNFHVKVFCTCQKATQTVVHKHMYVAQGGA